ncbi:MAG: phosphopyruvate hydratase [Clostridiales bacterium]|nr:phosphopyruvate hydratase [Clostridiales bacterium]
MKIQSIKGLQVFDSRGNPTLKAYVTLNNGTVGEALVPSGASTGQFEAYELRDGGKDYHGKSVTKAVDHINTAIQEALVGKDADCQSILDEIMIKADGSENKSNLGANAILAVSLAAAKAAAAAYHMPLYRYIGGISGVTLPIPMMNILNGGAHAANTVDIQEFMIMPYGAKTFAESMRMCTEIYHTLGKILKEDHFSVSVGDEGGFAPDLASDEMALEYIVKATTTCGYEPGRDIFIAIDAAVSDWYKNGAYTLPKRKITVSRDELIDYFKALKEKYPIISIEDPLSETDFEGFASITEQMSGTQIVGDDLFVTNEKRLARGISEHAANAILIKPNQIGTLTETINTIRLARRNGYHTVMSHRSGETEDTTIADIAVAMNCTQIKTGAPCRSERVAKYNRLLEIETELGAAGSFGRR